MTSALRPDYGQRKLTYKSYTFGDENDPSEIKEYETRYFDEI